MRKIITAAFVTACSFLLLAACNNATPENYFDEAVLNTNMMMGFASDGFERQLEQPSVKLVEGTKDQTAPMKRKEVVDNQIHYLDESFAKVKNLKETAETGHREPTKESNGNKQTFQTQTVVRNAVGQRERPFDGFDHLGSADFSSRPAERITAMRSCMRHQQTFLNQLLKNLSQQLQWNIVVLGNFPSTPRGAFRPLGQVHQRHKTVIDFF